MTAKPEERHAQLELCIPYVFGRLNPGNRKQFESHLTSGCEQCMRELSGLYEATALLPLLLRQETPQSGLRQRILSRASSRKQPEPQRTERPSTHRESPVTPATRPDHPWYRYTAMVLGVLLIVALVIFVYQLTGTTASQEKKIVELQTRVQQNDEVFAVLNARQVEMVSLSGVEPGSTFYGKILWDSLSRNAILQIAGLPAAAEGKRYQLWMLKEKKYISITQFNVDNAHAGVFKTLTIPAGENRDIEGFTVTLEPKEGGVQPSGAIYLRGAR